MKTYCSKLAVDVHVLLLKGDSILLLRRFHTGFEDGQYSLIAGRRKQKETIQQAAIREAREEAGVDIAPEDLRLIHVVHYSTKPHRVGFFFHSIKPYRVGFFFFAKKWQGQEENREPNKCDHLDWFPLEQLPSNMISYVRTAIALYQDNITYSEFSWNQRD